MGWIDPVVSYASLPRLTAPEPRDAWTGAVDNAADRRWELIDTAVSACALDLGGCEALEIDNSTFEGVAFVGRVPPRTTIAHSAFVGCDLSGARFDSLRNVRFADCKLVGADFGSAEMLDVSFQGCVLRIVNLRMVRLRRVEFVDCALHDVDAYGLDAEDVSVAGSELERVNIDQLRARRVDLRGARRLGLEHFKTLNGCLVDEDQLLELRYQLAFAAGLSIERDIGDDAAQND